MISSVEIIKIALNKFNKKDKLEYKKNQIANFQRFYRYNIKKIARKKKLKKIEIIQSAIKSFTSKNIISLENNRHLILQNILRTFIAKKALQKKKFRNENNFNAITYVIRRNRKKEKNPNAHNGEILNSKCHK